LVVILSLFLVFGHGGSFSFLGHFLAQIDAECPELPFGNICMHALYWYGHGVKPALDINQLA
jgi:hypothetical protein